MTTVLERQPTSPRAGYARVFAWVALGALAILGTWLLVGAWREGMSGGRDFVQDYAAVVKIGEGRNPYEPYNDVTQELFGGPPHRGKLYSFHAPSSLPLIVWLLPFATVWGYPGAFLVWGTVSILALWAICWLTLRRVGAPNPALAGLLAALALQILPPIRENFEEGQLNVVVAAGMVGCWAARREGQPVLAGVLLGAAFALKPIPGLFFVYYLWRRDWRLVGAALAALAALSIAGLWLGGLEGAWLWATVNYPSHANVWPAYPDNASLRGFLTRTFGPSEWKRPPYPLPFASTLLWTASGALLGLLLLVIGRTPGLRVPSAGAHPPSADAHPPSAATHPPGARVLGWLRPPASAAASTRDDLEMAALSVLTLLVTPIVWPHYYVVLVMPVALVACWLWRRGRSGQVDVPSTRWAWLGLGALAVGVAIMAPHQYVEPYAAVGGQQLIALVLVYAAALVALWQCARVRNPLTPSSTFTPPLPLPHAGEGE